MHRHGRCASVLDSGHPCMNYFLIIVFRFITFYLILGSSSIQPVTVGALAFITASAIPYGLIACGIVVSVLPTLILALFIQKYLVQGLSLGAIKG